MPQPIARPVDEPHAALVATCECGLRIVRLAWNTALWRHDDRTVTCTPPAPPADPTFEDVLRGTL
jgi:hypothetical protein